MDNSNYEAVRAKIEGFPDYSISEDGIVTSRRRFGAKGGTVKVWLDGPGYPCVRLWHKRKPKIFRMHRLMAGAFIPNPEGLPQINHKDGNKNNFSITNLEWCSASHNVRHAYESGLRVKVSSSGEKYIYICKTTNKFIVVIHGKNREKIRLGRYHLISDAVQRRDLFLTHGV